MQPLTIQQANGKDLSKQSNQVSAFTTKLKLEGRLICFVNRWAGQHKL